MAQRTTNVHEALNFLLQQPEVGKYCHHTLITLSVWSAVPQRKLHVHITFNIHNNCFKRKILVLALNFVVTSIMAAGIVNA